MHLYKSGDKSLDSEYHTLFIEEKKEQRELVNPEENLYRITPKHKRYCVYIDNFHESKKGLHSVFHELRKAEANDQLELRISSDGGSVLEGQQFFNLIIEKFRERTTTYLDNHGYSMGALLFCMSYKRVIYPYSDLMFHNYAHVIYGKGGNVKSKVKHKSQLLEDFFHDLIVDRNFLSEEEFQQMLLGHDFWMDAKEMCQRGIATHVIVGTEQLTAEKFLVELKKEQQEKDISLESPSISTEEKPAQEEAPKAKSNKKAKKKKKVKKTKKAVKAAKTVKTASKEPVES